MKLGYLKDIFDKEGEKGETLKLVYLKDSIFKIFFIKIKILLFF